jgi:acyl-CoA-binding protein
MSKINKKNDYNKKSILKNTLKNKKKLTQFGGTDEPIYVLSWNICWQTMTGKTNKDASEKLVGLVNDCKSKKI